MIDYKLILILVLSIVLLYLYNKVETLKSDISELRKSQIEDNKVVQKILLTQDTMLLQNKNINSLNCVDGFCKMPPKKSNTINIPKVVEQQVEQQVEEQILIPELKQESSEIQLENEALNKTDEFSATENDSDSEMSNCTSSEHIVIYSNEKKENLITKYEDVSEYDKSIEELLNEGIDTQAAVNENQNNENIDISYLNSVNEDISDSNTINAVAGNSQIEIQEEDIINCIKEENEENVNVEDLIDRLGAEPLVFEDQLAKLSGINLNSTYMEIIDSSNTNEDFEEDENDSKQEIDLSKVNSESIKSDLDYDISDENEDDDDTDNNDELNETMLLNGKFILNNLNTYRLLDLQDLAKKNDISTTKVKNGKIKNKTKKELYVELNNISLQK